jgi:hypothetical protein
MSSLFYTLEPMMGGVWSISDMTLKGIFPIGPVKSIQLPFNGDKLFSNYILLGSNFTPA